ncbi:hypothetical protein ACR42D_10110 [Desulfovibrio caledoniensis]
MPTCKFKPCAVLPKFKGNAGTPKISIYPAELWEDDGGRPGLYRVMQGEAWRTREGEPVSFFTIEGISRIILLHLSQGLGAGLHTPGVPPETPQGTAVRFWPHGQTQPTDTYTRTAPFVDAHGEWRVWIFFRDNAVLLADLERRPDPRAAA